MPPAHRDVKPARTAELVNAAFRAVHSVKGGAAAFGFDHLIGFAHVFETVMDGLRSGRLQLGSDIVNLLMRSGDVMETLIEQARDGGDVDSGHVDRVRQELEEQIGRSSAEEAPEDGPSAPTSAAPPPPAPAEAEPEPGEPREVIVSLIPSEDFIHGGHDPLRVIRAARELDLVAAEPIGDLPPLAELTPEGCPIGWKLRFETDRPPSAFTDFFSVYEHIAVVEIVDENWSEAPAAPAGVEAAPASIAPTESKGVPAPSAAAAPPEAGGKDAGKDAGVSALHVAAGAGHELREHVLLLAVAMPLLLFTVTVPVALLLLAACWGLLCLTLLRGSAALYRPLRVRRINVY